MFISTFRFLGTIRFIRVKIISLIKTYYYLQYNSTLKAPASKKKGSKLYKNLFFFLCLYLPFNFPVLFDSSAMKHRRRFPVPESLDRARKVPSPTLPLLRRHRSRFHPEWPKHRHPPSPAQISTHRSPPHNRDGDRSGPPNGWLALNKVVDSADGADPGDGGRSDEIHRR